MRISLVNARGFLPITFCLCLLVSIARAQDSGENVVSGNILTGVKLSQGLNLGVDSSKQAHKWLSPEKTEGYLVMSFLADQDWSAAFMTVGSVTNRKGDRRFRDYSGFKTLSVEMRGLSGGEKIQVGIKSKDQEDDGSETKISVTLTSEWKTYEFPLEAFKGAVLKELYVVAEFVYTCQRPQTIQVRSIRYLKQESTKPVIGGSPCDPSQSGTFDVMLGTKLSGGFGIGVDSSERRREWLEKKANGEFMVMAFPSEQDWSAVFLTVGPPSQRLEDGRQFMDLSTYDVLSVDLKGAVGGEKVDVGIKTNTQDDDGTETKISITLTSEWKTYPFPLIRFVGTSPAKLYVVAEFVYEGSKAQTVFFRNIKYLKQ